MTTMTLTERQSLLVPLVTLTRDAFHNDSVTETDVASHVFAVDLTVLVYLEDRLVGFSSCAMLDVLGTPTCYLVGSAMAPGERATGLYNLLIGARIAYATMRLGTTETTFATRTQNPIVVRRMAELGAYPVGTIVDDDGIRLMTIALIEQIHQFFGSGSIAPMPDYDPDRRVIRGAYSSAMDLAIPTSGDASIDRFCAANLDVASGDAFLLAARRNHRLTGELVYRSLQRVEASPSEVSTLMAAFGL